MYQIVWNDERKGLVVFAESKSLSGLGEITVYLRSNINESAIKDFYVLKINRKKEVVGAERFLHFCEMNGIEPSRRL